MKVALSESRPCQESDFGRITNEPNLKLKRSPIAITLPNYINAVETENNLKLNC